LVVETLTTLTGKDEGEDIVCSAWKHAGVHERTGKVVANLFEHHVSYNWATVNLIAASVGDDCRTTSLIQGNSDRIMPKTILSEASHVGERATVIT